MVIWKYKSDGTLDLSFATNGVLVYNNSYSRDEGSSIITDLNGSPFVSGYSIGVGGGIFEMVLWKYSE